MPIRKITQLFVVLIIFTALLVPELVYARAGGGHSSGSRGTRTYQASPSSAQPLERSVTPKSEPVTGGQQNPNALNNGTSHPFLSGIAGGIVGMGIAHMLFGGGGMGGGGGLIQLLLIGGLIYYGIRFFRSRGMKPGASSIFPMDNLTGNASSGNIISKPDISQAITVTESDIAAFKQSLLDIQNAWSSEDFNRLRQYVTPEMLHYFNDELSANVSRGLSNRIEQVEVQKVEPVESWQEYNLTYASVIMQWTASDYMVRLDRQPNNSDYVASGDAKKAETAQEQWTFSRVEGGRWLLSAIQQMG